MSGIALTLAGLAAMAGAASAPASVDPFVAAIVACGAADTGAIAAVMNGLKAEPLSVEEIDEIRLGQAMGFAYGLVQEDVSQSDIDRQPKIDSQVAGWRAGRIKVVVTVQTRADKTGRLCDVVVPYDAYDQAVSVVGRDLKKGRPDKRVTFHNLRATAWDLAYEGAIPRFLVISADYGGDRKATSVQIVSK